MIDLTRSMLSNTKPAAESGSNNKTSKTKREKEI
jgi:hypothetical protein